MTDSVEIWKSILTGAPKSWVLFRNGTIVIFTEPQADLAQAAISLMKEFGPVHAGSPAGDFNVITLTDAAGWVATSHHNDILTYVSPEEIGDEEPALVTIGLLGRSKRDEDAQSLEVVHIEDAHS